MQQFVDSAFITAAGAGVLTASVAITAIVFFFMKGVSRNMRGLIYILTLLLAALAMGLFAQQKKDAQTIAGPVGELLDKCRQTLDTVDGLVRAKLIVVDNADQAHQIAEDIKAEIDNSTCVRE